MGNKRTRGTCQCCGGVQALDKTNTLGNHGYLRPGCGWIVGNCAGAGHLAYELSCELSKSWLIRVKNKLAAMGAELADLQANTVEVLAGVQAIKIGYGAHNKRTPQEWIADGFRPVSKGGWGIIGWTKTFEFDVTRDHVPSDERGEHRGCTFEHYRNLRMSQLTAWIKAAQADAVELERRIAAWVYAPEKLVPEKKVPKNRVIR